MANINLLPWREQRRELQRKEFFVILGSIAGLGLLAVLLAHITINGQIGGQADRNNYLQTNIAEFAGNADRHARRNCARRCLVLGFTGFRCTGRA